MTWDMLFQNWSGLGRTLVVGVLAYVALVVLVRIAGKRSLAQMNAFDWVVTVALGSTLASILLSQDVALAEGVVAFSVLIGLQLIITWASVRSSTVTKLVKSTPSLLFYEGEFLDEEMKKNRVIEAEVISAIRSQGMPSIGSVKAVVLETDGSFSVLSGDPGEKASSLENVTGKPEQT
jgi:uncharacterized membrane protein YcaP (DUF421 family)